MITIAELKALVRRPGDVYFDTKSGDDGGLHEVKVVKKDLLERLDALEADPYWEGLLFDVWDMGHSISVTRSHLPGSDYGYDYE